MIDFRYLLTTIAAIFLALAIGLLIGSGLLADPIAQDLERQVEETISRNNDLRGEIDDLKARIDVEENFGREMAARWIEGELPNAQVVLFRFEETEGALVDRVRDAIELAGGTVPTMITVTDRMALDDDGIVSDLAAELSKLGVEDDDLATALGTELGRRAAADANGAGDLVFPVIQAVAEGPGLIEVEAEEGDEPIPVGADFVVVGGARGEPPFSIAPFAEALLTGLTEHTSEVVVAEGWESEWALVPELRRSEVRELASTVDHGDTAAGVISIVAELGRFVANEPGHYGFRDGADGVLPEAPGG
jgi:Copper transport outer membrane protein, MctB